MVELCVEPVVEAVALLARSREPIGKVIGICSRAILGRMATVAIRRHGDVLADCLALVTGGAIYCRVRAQQRKPVLVLSNLRDLYVPSLDAVALFAIRSQLALVNVGMAIGTPGSGIGKDGFDMALVASY